jgi:hypothetical protein
VALVEMDWNPETDEFTTARVAATASPAPSRMPDAARGLHYDEWPLLHGLRARARDDFVR